MFAEKLVLFFAAIFLLQQNVSGFNEPRIVNGSATPDGVFEFLPRLNPLLQNHKEKDITGGMCSSTIISNRHILTAAHCVIVPSEAGIDRVLVNLIDYRPKKLDGRNRAHINFRNSSLQTRYYFHPSYIFTRTFRDDIAIIEFPEGTNFNITPITLASNYVEKEGDMAIAAGYGIYKWQGELTRPKGIPEHPEVLQNATVPVHTDCPFPSSIICSATYERFGDQGDSGGPLMIERNGKIYQVGIASTVFKHSKEKVANFYTRISLQCDWISKITKGQAKCEPLPEETNPQPQQPIKPNQPSVAPNNKPTTEIPSNKNDVTSPPKHSDPEAQSGNSSIGLTFNILLFFFIGIFYFA